MILVPTLFLGRFFCGWICPMGTLQHCVGNCIGGQARQAAHRVEPLQALADHEVCGADCWTGGGVLRIAVIGWLDPFSLLVRSFGLSLLPAFNLRVRAVLVADGAEPCGR